MLGYRRTWISLLKAFLHSEPPVTCALWSHVAVQIANYLHYFSVVLPWVLYWKLVFMHKTAYSNFLISYVLNIILVAIGAEETAVIWLDQSDY